MLFGIGAKTEEISIGSLRTALDSYFDRKLGGFGSKAAGITRDLPNAKLQFSEACKKFEQLEAEPELEYFFIDNINFIKGQKLFYCRALRRIIDEWNIQIDDTATIYGRYSAILSNTEKFVNEVLKANNSFKKVIHSYPKHLDLLKGSFSPIEKIAESLRNELNRTGSALLEYNALSEQITKLSTLREELSYLNRDTNPQADGAALADGDRINEREQEALKEITEKERVLSKLHSEISDAHVKITSLVTPLERPSRKFDHTSSRKRKLSSFIADPVNTITDESDYAEFKLLLGELKKYVDSGDMDIKNSPRINENISALLNGNIHETVLLLRKLQKDESALRVELAASQASLNKLKELKGTSKKRAEDAEYRKKRASELDLKIAESKRVAEKLILDYYNKRISIILD
jgi:hypothetical protein